MSATWMTHHKQVLQGLETMHETNFPQVTQGTTVFKISNQNIFQDMMLS